MVGEEDYGEISRGAKYYLKKGVYLVGTGVVITSLAFLPGAIPTALAARHVIRRYRPKDDSEGGEESRNPESGLKDITEE